MTPALHHRITKYLNQALSNLEISFAGALTLSPPPQEELGDLSCSIALSLATQLKKNPLELAVQITQQLQQILLQAKDQDIDSITVLKPGFINIKIAAPFLLESLATELGSPSSGLATKKPPKKVIIEFTDPNPFKEFHIGHLFSNTVGESVARLLESQGAEVYRVCYQGDAGMHVAKSLWGMKQLMAERHLTIHDLSQQTLSDRIKFLGQSYALGAAAYETDPAAKEAIKNINVLTFLSAQEYLQQTSGWKPQVDYRRLLSDFDPAEYATIKELYTVGKDWSLAYFEVIYQRLGTTFKDYFFESLVGEYGMAIVKQFLAQGVFKESQGAVIFPGSEYGLHDRVFINSLGLPTYECKELGLAPEKYRRYPYDLSIIITGNEIKEYFKVLLQALAATNPDLAQKTRHFSHGMVRLAEGKMSSRKGNVITGEQLINQVKAKVLERFAAEPDTTKPDAAESNAAEPGQVPAKEPFTPAEQQELAERLSIAAIKYTLLKSDLGKDVIFSFEESLNLHGNSGPYLLYTYVRAQSVLQKWLEGEGSGATQPAQKQGGPAPLKKPISNDTNEYITKQIDLLIDNKSYSSYSISNEEKKIIKYILMYSSVLQRAAQEFAPHQICTYLHTLAQAFNTYYAQTSILKAETEPALAARILIARGVQQVLAAGLTVLGIKTVQRM